MSQSLTTAAAAAWSGATELHKGRSYIRTLSGLTLEPVSPQSASTQSGAGGVVIRGEAQGQERYQIQATLQAGRVTRADCSCYVGSGGHCKHTAALLSRYVQAPGDFRQLTALSELLGQLSTEQLRDLIGTLLTLVPSLRLVVDAVGRSSSAGASAQVAAIPALFAQIEADYGHRDDGYDQWDDEGPDTSALDTVLEEADAQQGSNPAAALAVYLQMIGSAETAYETWADSDEGLFDHLLSGAVDGIMSLVTGGRLVEPARSDAVEAVLALENLYLLAQAQALGDFAAALGVPERAALTRLLEQLRDQTRSDHQRGQVAHALLRLVPADQQTPAQREAVLLSSGDLEQITEHFLNSGDPGARGRLSRYLHDSSQSLEPVFGLIQSHEAGELLEQVISNRVAKRQWMTALHPETHWLFEHLASTGRRKEAAELARRGLSDSLDVHWERLLRAVSFDWQADWAALFKSVTGTPHQLNGMMKLLLSGEHDIAEAEQFDRQYGNSLSVTYRTALAGQLAAEPGQQARAAEIYLEVARDLIAARGRENYRAAVALLLHLSALLGAAQAQAVIGDIALRHNNLPSFKDELRKASLL